MYQDLKMRFGGLALCVAGAALGWYFILGPLDAARHGAPEVRYSLKAFLAVPAFIVFGIAFLLRGSSPSYRDAARKSLTATGWFLLTLVALATAAGFWWFQQQFAALGYS